jgi:hypothetical protein
MEATMETEVAKGLLDRIVSNLLYSEASQDKLVELIWHQWTDEQKKALADAAHKAAMERVTKIVESRLYAVGSGRDRANLNLFAKFVQHSVNTVFVTENINQAIQDQVRAEYEEFLAGLRGTVKHALKDILLEAVNRGITSLDSYSIRQALTKAMNGQDGESGNG